jgi:two-component system response regulator
VKQILLVEDNAGDVLMIRQIIAEHARSVKVNVAMDGEQAIRILEDRHFDPDLIILDLNIPKIPGLAVLERCKPTAPVVVFTSSTNPAEMERAKELGAKEFAHKPIDFEEFSNVVTRMVRAWVEPGASEAVAE